MLHEYIEAGSNHIYILRGNHDGERTLKHGSPLQEVEAVGICSVIWNSLVIGKYLFLPYTTETIGQFIIQPDTLAFCHLDIPNAIPGIEKQIGRGIDSFLPTWISSACKQVFAGHIHHVQRHGNIEVVGSAVRVTTSEQNEISRILQVEDDGSFKSILLPSRPLTSINVVYGTSDGMAQLQALENSDLSTNIVSVRIVCPHTEAHKFDNIKFEDALRKRCYYLRFIFDVIKEKELRIKELDGTKSDIEIVKLFLEKQKISDMEEVLKCCNEVMKSTTII
jgi:hypothetical protein